MNAIEAFDIGVHFGGLVALDSVSIAARPGEIFAIIGPNGAGKTTLFNIVSGVYRLSQGRVLLTGDDVSGLPSFVLARRGLTRTFQNLQVFFRMSAIENVMVGCHLSERRALIPHLFGLPSVHRQNRESRMQAQTLLDAVGIGAVAERPAGELPYGVLKRLEIARALAAKPAVLMLDEPVAGCNSTESQDIANVIRKVADTGVAIVLVEHDMRLVMSLADRIHVLARGRTLAEGRPDEVRRDPAVIEAYLGAGHAATTDAEVSHAGG